MLQHGSGEQGADNQVSEMMEKFPREIRCHIVHIFLEKTESRFGGKDLALKTTEGWG